MCQAATLNDLIDNYNELKNHRPEKIFIFQSGIHIAAYGVNIYHLDMPIIKLVVTGMTNVTIKCVAESPMIQFTSARNIKISNLRFQDCRDIQVGTKSKNVTFEIASSRLTCSCLRFKFDHTRSK